MEPATGIHRWSPMALVRRAEEMKGAPLKLEGETVRRANVAKHRPFSGDTKHSSRLKGTPWADLADACDYDDPVLSAGLALTPCAANDNCRECIDDAVIAPTSCADIGRSADSCVLFDDEVMSGGSCRPARRC